MNTAYGMFMELDAKQRERFENDPGKFVEFVQDDKNLDEAEELGFLDPVKVKARKEAAAAAAAAAEAANKGGKPA